MVRVGVRLGLGASQSFRAHCRTDRQQLQHKTLTLQLLSVLI